jgi:Ca2+-binding EF-hand superfamily protein
VAPRKEVDKFFKGVDMDQSGLIEFNELMAALTEF